MDFSFEGDGGPRVGIVGTFDVQNFGDLLFPLIARAELEKRIPGVDLRVYSPTAPKGDWPFAVHPSKTLPGEIAQMSALLVGGGQLVRFDDTYPIPLPQGAFAPDAYFLHPAQAAVAAGTPLIWNAIGTWTGSPRCISRERELGRLIAASALSGVRDGPTHALFSSLAPAAQIEQVPDTAFGLSAIWPKDASAQGTAPWQTEIGLSGPYMVVQADRRIARHRDILESLQQRLGLRIVVLPVCYCHGDRSEGFPALPGDTDRVGTWPAPREISEIIAGAELLVATSLHASITAIAHGVRVARVPYPYERKFEQLGGFEGVARLDDPADLKRLLARSNGAEPLLLQHQARLRVWWDRVADEVTANQRHPTSTFVPIETPPPPARRPVKVAVRASAGRLVRSAVRSLRRLAEGKRPAAYRGRSILDFHAIRRSPINREPFRWGHQTNLFSAEDSARLAAEYPVTGFWNISGIEKDRHYRFRARSLIPMGACAPGSLRGLGDAWHAFALDLLSPEYRAAVSEAVGLDLTHAIMEANLTQYGEGHELSPHLDLKEKLVTQIFYFNEDWRLGDGGCLGIMRSESSSQDDTLIPPKAGTSAILVRSHNSWHRVSPVREGHDQQRCSLNVIFHLPESKSTMWPQWPIAMRRQLHQWASPVLSALKLCRKLRDNHRLFRRPM